MMRTRQLIGWGSGWLVMLALAGLVVLPGCNPEPEQPQDPPTTQQEGEAKPAGDQTAAVGDVKPYPLDVCLVSGESLDSMGGPVTLVHEGQEFKFCCAPCTKSFNEEPGKYTAMLQERVGTNGS